MHALLPSPPPLQPLPPCYPLQAPNTPLLPLSRPHPGLRCRELAQDYADKRPLVVGTLKGAVLFMSDLVRAMDPPPPGLQLEFVRASSYGSSTVSSGKVALNGTLSTADVAGRHVLLVSQAGSPSPPPCCSPTAGLCSTSGGRSRPPRPALPCPPVCMLASSV